jgi:hypothetical protein
LRDSETAETKVSAVVFVDKPTLWRIICPLRGRAFNKWMSLKIDGKERFENEYEKNGGKSKPGGRKEVW